MEASFRQRWIDRRAAELAQSGKAADVARAQAEKEFGERFDFSKPGQRKPAAK